MHLPDKISLLGAIRTEEADIKFIQRQLHRNVGLICRIYIQVKLEQKGCVSILGKGWCCWCLGIRNILLKHCENILTAISSSISQHT